MLVRVDDENWSSAGFNLHNGESSRQCLHECFSSRLSFNREMWTVSRSNLETKELVNGFISIRSSPYLPASASSLLSSRLRHDFLSTPIPPSGCFQSPREELPISSESDERENFPWRTFQHFSINVVASLAFVKTFLISVELAESAGESLISTFI